LSIKLADFGLAKIIGEESFTTTLCGTPSCKSPFYNIRWHANVSQMLRLRYWKTQTIDVTPGLSMSGH
jgi:hypothetical protein